MFDATLGAHISPGELEHIWRGQPGPPAERAWLDPAGAWYCTGIDWAQKRDSTVAVVARCDTTPLQVVAVYRTQRRSWRVMTEHVGALLDEYPGPAEHDATGGGQGRPSSEGDREEVSVDATSRPALGSRLRRMKPGLDLQRDALQAEGVASHRRGVRAAR